jgi:hypothetical protein
VSRTRCGILYAAPQSRDRPNTDARYGPGSAAHHAAKNGALRCVRGTNYPRSGSLGGTGEAWLPAVAPPSIGSVMPVTQRDSSQAKYSAP